MRKLDNYKAIILPSIFVNIAVFMITFNLLYLVYINGAIFIALSILVIAQQIDIREKETQEKLRKEVEQEEIRRNERMQTRLKILENARDILQTRGLSHQDLENEVKWAENRLANKTSNITEQEEKDSDS